ncbi:hypothetical protein V0R50_30480 [Pseudomonas sp. 148P]|uniref:Uncharacterized protein n=1 Tax=Pseudomonas ulcerans TaxID=3115852 RepID=A0ABU7I193_9PSED|nr:MULTISPECIES: hypothetical protein [unclassified Pseudomonas]MEE1926319.1 hypothetical protein [Pseudomonas sp. 147P]MEE1937572.1 hypothetical protein [Pseudomonas sp. 148P]
MTHTLLALNALALTAVIALGLLPKETPVHSLDYRTSMQARPALLGQTSGEQQQERPARGQDHYSF